MIFMTWLPDGQKGDDEVERQEFATFVAALKTYYPREQLLPNNQAMELWFRQLQDIPYMVAETALNKWVAVNKWSPSIADIRGMAVSVTQGEKMLWSDGWEKVQAAIRYHGYYGETEAMTSFDDVTRQAVKQLGWKELCLSENTMQDRANFRMVFEQIADRKQEKQMLPYSLNQMIADIQKRGIGCDEFKKLYSAD